MSDAGEAERQASSGARDSQPGSDYLIGDLLGSGPTGEVYAGRDNAGRPVAVKFLRADLADDREVASRFATERDHVLRLDGPHLVRVRDLVVEDGCAIAVVTDLVEGVDMRRALGGTGGAGFPAAVVARVGAGIAHGLAAAHAAGFTHGGVKAENVLLDSATAPPAVRLSDAAVDRLLAGTPGRPAASTATPDVAADLHALGSLLYELACGRPPGRSAPTARPAGVPEPLWVVLRALLAPDPADRPASADCVAAVLATLAEDLPAGPAAGAATPAAARRPEAAHDLLPVAPQVPLPLDRRPTAQDPTPRDPTSRDPTPQAPTPQAPTPQSPPARRPPPRTPVRQAESPALGGPSPGAPTTAAQGPDVPRPAAGPALPRARRNVRPAVAGAACVAVLLAGVAWNLSRDATGGEPTAGQVPLPVRVGSAAPVTSPDSPVPPAPGGTGPLAPPAILQPATSSAAPASASSASDVLRPSAPAAPAVVAGDPVPPSGSDRTHTATSARPLSRAVSYLSNRDGDWQLYRADAGGTRATRLTDVRGGVMGPVYSPDASRVAYFAAEGDGGSGLYVMDADGTGQLRLTGNAIRPVFSPDGTAIAFEGDWNGTNEVFVIKTDGTGLRRLTSDGTGRSARWPAFSPDGKRIAYAAYRAEDGAATGSLWVVGRDGRGRERLAEDGVQPAFSPDGKRLAFTSTRDGDAEIFLMGADGSWETRVTHAEGTDWSPSFSPDGTRILFLSNRGDDPGEGYDVYLMDAGGRNERRLTKGSHTRSAATFSPDGKQIAYNRLSAKGDDHFDVYVMDVDGSGRERFASPGYGPVWAAPRS